MRKYLIPLLLAGALVPAAALAKDDGPARDRDRAERSSQRESRAEARSEKSHSAQRTERGGNADRPERAERSERPAQTQRVDRMQNAGREPRGEHRVERREPTQQAGPVQQVEPAQGVERTERRESGVLGSLRAAAREQEYRDDHRGDHDGDHRWNRDGDHRWDRDWRHDRRYDWSRHRHRHHSLFRLGRYYDPYGWNYRRWSIGFSLWPSYYGSNYWLNDPWMYRLPPTYGPYRWVRYYDDALLVNIYTGQVVDVIYNFFW